MVAKERSPSPKVEVGEIDTRAPFQSVKDAVSLFGEGAFSGSGEKPAIRKTKPQSAERVLVNKTQLHLKQKELNKLKEQLMNAESTRAQALIELEKARVTHKELTQKLASLSESKESAIQASEAAKNQAKQLEEANNGNLAGTDCAWMQDMETERAHYMNLITELDAAKQELVKIRQDCDASLEAKVAAFKEAAEAEEAAKANAARVNELSKEVTAVHESIEQVKLASVEAQQEQAKIFSEKDVLRQAYKATSEESAKKLASLQKDFNPEISRNLEAQLVETMNEIEALREQMENEKASDLDSVRSVTLELDDAKESLHKVAEEGSSLRSLVEALKVEIENVKKEHDELKEKEGETESIAGNLHVKLWKTKTELEACLAEESKARGASSEMIATLNQLSLEIENARRDAEEMKIKAEEVKKEAETTKSAVQDAEKQLRMALEEAEEAKLAEERALEQIRTLSERTNAARASTSESGGQITLSKDEYESLSRKVEESNKLAEMRVAAAMAQVEAVKASENEALKRLEATQKEIEDMKAATEEAKKRAEMAEAAKKAVEGELRRWREREQKKAADAASRILAEAELSVESSPRHYRIQKQNSQTKTVQGRKMEKSKTFVSKKTLLPTLSGMFNSGSGLFKRKRNQVEGGSPSYLPGERPL